MQNDEGSIGRPLYNLVYCSRASAPMDKPGLEKIIATAQHYNPRFGITGLLVYGSGIFFQWLEGPKDNVTSLMKMIAGDARHVDVVLLSEDEEIRERLFPNWDMELVQSEDISLVLEDAIEQAQDSRQKKALRVMHKALKSEAARGL